ncbi:MAG TPA: flagellar hook capping FlgD N-terminal domain-containing protein [Acidisarcina sp.]|nr:flagellar hook capping FlgD N-terminal domain-containing protein [Acidisarcina sp.]
MQVGETQNIQTTHPLTAATQAAQTVKANAASASTSTSSNTANITSNDFLTLLVAEMRHQDPTANTDPNQYINQLVQVNSLQQLIEINTALGGNNTTSTTGSSAAVANALSRNHAGASEVPTAPLATTAKSQS